MKKLILGVLALSTLGAAALAAPTIGGISGLIYMPTAESLRYKEFSIGVDTLWSGQQGNNQQSVFYKANLGTFKGLELGFVGGSQPNEGVFLNAKYYLLSDASRYPLGIALGVANLSSSSLSNIYMVASKRFPQSFDGHLGFQATFPTNQVSTSLLLGLEFFPTSLMSIAVDAAGEGTNYILNTGFRINLSNSLALRIYGLNLFDGTPAGSTGAFLPSDPTLSVGMIWTDVIE